MAELTEKSKRGSFDGWVKVIFIAGMLVFAFHACTHMVAAGDTWVAMACGRHFDNHPVNTVEPFSANSHKAGPTKAEIATWPKWQQSIANKFDIETVQKWHPTGWVNQNWLTHLIFYKLASFGQDPGEYNYDALVWWKFTIYIISAFCIYYTGRLMGVSVPGAAFASSMGLFIGRTFLDIRPAGYANMLVAVYILVLALTVYKNYRWIWLAVPVTVFWANVHGGYIYIFIMMVPFIGLNFISIPSRQKFTSIGLNGIYHTLAAGLTSFIAMVIFNPFKLTNLTHTFEISLSKHAESWRKVNEWHRAFEWDNPVGDEIPFTVMFVVALIVLIAWFVIWAKMRPVLTSKKHRKSQAPVPLKPGEYQWPKVNLAAIFVASLTVYMAVKSRRFIPLAGFAACPVIILMIEQTVAMISVKSNFVKSNKIELPEMPAEVRKTIIGIGCASLIIFGSWWAAKYHRIFISPWPNDVTHDYNPEARDSVFMRMTASNVKPFDVTQFMRENDVSGNMFNYWTEGGALAFGQTPDPETGKTPLQLFMDGRAQAAYNHDKFLLWQYYYAGGEPSIPIRTAKRFATKKEMGTIRNWLDDRMKTAKIWVFVLPNSQFVKSDNPMAVNYFALTMPGHPDWRLVYVDDYQQMYVDTSVEQGKQLVNAMLTNKAKYPNEYSRKLSLGKLYLRLADQKYHTQGFELIKEAFELNDSQMSMAALTNDVGRHPKFRKEVTSYIENYVNNLQQQKDTLSKEGGYSTKLVAGLIGAKYLQSHYKAKGDSKFKEYKIFSNECLQERKKLSLKVRW